MYKTYSKKVLVFNGKKEAKVWTNHHAFINLAEKKIGVNWKLPLDFSFNIFVSSIATEKIY